MQKSNSISVPNSATDTGFSEDLNFLEKNLEIIMLDEFLSQGKEHFHNTSYKNDNNDVIQIVIKNTEDNVKETNRDNLLKEIDVLENIDSRPSKFSTALYERLITQF